MREREGKGVCKRDRDTYIKRKEQRKKETKWSFLSFSFVKDYLFICLCMYVIYTPKVGLETKI